MALCSLTNTKELRPMNASSPRAPALTLQGQFREEMGSLYACSLLASSLALISLTIISSALAETCGNADGIGCVRIGVQRCYKDESARICTTSRTVARSRHLSMLSQISFAIAGSTEPLAPGIDDPRIGKLPICWGYIGNAENKPSKVGNKTNET